MVSVIIPVYNSQNTIKQLLNSLFRQDFNGEYEIIVVDDGSCDSTASILSGYNNVRVIKQNNAGPAAARNKGAINAKGDIILFTDSDCEVFPDWIKQMVKPFMEHPGVTGVKGAYRTKQKSLVARFAQLEYEDKYDKMKQEKYIDFIDTYSAGFRKEAFMAEGGYDTSFPVACAEDVDLSYRLDKKGHKMLFIPHALVFHRHPEKLAGYLAKKYKFAYWRVKAVRKNPDKAIKDSHTPFDMKAQLILILFIILSLPFLRVMPAVTLFSLGLYIIAGTPFTVKAFKKDIVVGMLTPFFLFLRSIAQLLGVAAGILNSKI